MALPTITEVGRNSITPYYTAGNSGNANASANVVQGVAVYAVDAAGGQSDRYTYAELFEALNSVSGFNIDLDSETNLADFDAPSRTFTLISNPSGEASIICLRRGTLFHEIPGSTRIINQSNEFILPILGAPVLYPSGEGSAANIAEAQPIYDTDFTGIHEIMLGTVWWQMRTGKPFQIPGGTGSASSHVRPADFGDPTKVSTPRGETTLLLAPFLPGPNQIFRSNDWRLTIEAAGTSTRVDIDFYGTGVIDGPMTIIRNTTQTGFFHNGNSNPNSNIRLRTISNATIGTTTLRREFSGVEPFTTNPAPSRHVYLDTDGLKTTAALDLVNSTVNLTEGQAQAAFVGAGRFQNSDTRNGIVLQGIKSNSQRYWKSQFSGSDVVDILHIDPATNFTADNTPFNMAESGSSDRRKDTIFLRSVGVDCQDSEGMAKSSPGWVVGFQASGTDRARRSAYFNSIVPNTRSLADGRSMDC